MATDTIKIRASMSSDPKAAGLCTVKALIKHDMETGLRKDAKTDQLIPAHFIQELICEHNGKPVMNANWGISISKNPYISFEFRGAKAGDKLALRWTDNKGDKDGTEITIS